MSVESFRGGGRGSSLPNRSGLTVPRSAVKVRVVWKLPVEPRVAFREREGLGPPGQVRGQHLRRLVDGVVPRAQEPHDLGVGRIRELWAGAECGSELRTWADGGGCAGATHSPASPAGHNRQSSAWPSRKTACSAQPKESELLLEKAAGGDGGGGFGRAREAAPRAPLSRAQARGCQWSETPASCRGSEAILPAADVDDGADGNGHG